ncbi:unnamed protein product [Arctia plantaginis]|uniref:Uncharacterized protein n=1 Tax=Arctia plantaginis TaxID=874455 RepID=A0A8S1B3Q3_ARCPL|nr:unnamed protein product [Arctia plantaginis]
MSPASERDSCARSLSHSVQELAGNSSAHNLRSRSPRLEQLIVSSPSYAIDVAAPVATKPDMGPSRQTTT